MQASTLLHEGLAGPPELSHQAEEGYFVAHLTDQTAAYVRLRGVVDGEVVPKQLDNEAGIVVDELAVGQQEMHRVSIVRQVLHHPGCVEPAAVRRQSGR